jgi:hypothetical protein
MIEFNGRGHIVPFLRVQSTLREFETVFVKTIHSDQRTRLFDGYCRYLEDLTKITGNGHIQWINGGFTTRSTNPGDIDIVTFLDYNIVHQHVQTLQAFIYPESLEEYGIDAYIVTVYPDNHRYIAQTLADRAYWMNQFDSTKPNRRGNIYHKGYLEIHI